MSKLVGWGASPKDSAVSVEAVNHRTGEKRTFAFETPVGASAVKMSKELRDLAADASAGMEDVTAITLRACCPEISEETNESVQRLVSLTGGMDSPLLVGMDRVLSGRSGSEEGWDSSKGDEVEDALPFSSKGKQG